jgi:hypothetical protein
MDGRPDSLSAPGGKPAKPVTPKPAVDSVYDGRAISGVVEYEQQERFVDAARASNFLCCSRKHLLNLARTGQVPAHPFGGGSRKSWLFRLSELAAFVLQSKGNGSKIPAGRSSETETR